MTYKSNSDDEKIPDTLPVPCQPAPVEHVIIEEEKKVEKVAGLCKKSYYGLDECSCSNCIVK